MSDTTNNIINDRTKESLIFYIESQCTLEEIYALWDLTKKQIETKYKIHNLETFHKVKLIGGLGKIKGLQFQKALDGNVEMLKHITRHAKIDREAAMRIIETPNNGRVKPKLTLKR
jgi:hypothetical protein